MNDNETFDRQAVIAEAVAQALMAQERLDGIDVLAIAAAVERALSGAETATPDEGKHPDELNSTNDD